MTALIASVRSVGVKKQDKESSGALSLQALKQVHDASACQLDHIIVVNDADLFRIFNRPHSVLA